MRDESREPQPTESLAPLSDSRLSIWTIRPEWMGWFYLLFTLQAVPLIATLWWSENQSGAHDNIASTISVVAGGSAALIFVAATATIIELEATMVLRHLLEKRDARKEREKVEKEREKERAAFERGIERGIERGRQLEREEQTARRIENEQNGNQE